MSPIEVFTENIQLPWKNINKKFIRDTGTSALTSLKLKDVNLTIILTDNSYIHSINRDYRKKDRPTDVISFSNRDNPFPEIEGHAEDLGDIYISLEKAEEQASEFEVSLTDEVKRLVIHGLLHLLGYDHEKSEKAAKEMQLIEDELLG